MVIAVTPHTLCASMGNIKNMFRFLRNARDDAHSPLLHAWVLAHPPACLSHPKSPYIFLHAIIFFYSCHVITKPA